MVDENKPPDPQPAAQGAPGAAGQAQAPPTAAEKVPDWATQVLEQAKQTRTAIGGFGERLKKMEQGSGPQAHSYSPPPPQYGAPNPWDAPVAPDADGNLTVEQIRQLVRQEAGQQDNSWAQAIVDTYGLADWQRNTVVDQANQAAINRGEDPIPDNLVQKHKAAVVQTLAQLNAPATPENALFVLRTQIAMERAAGAAESDTQRATAAAESALVSGATRMANTGSAAGPPPPAPDGIGPVIPTASETKVIREKHWNDGILGDGGKKS